MIAAAFAVAFLLLVVFRPGDLALRAATAWVLAAEAAVGIAGFVLHTRANLLASIGLWAMSRERA